YEQTRRPRAARCQEGSRRNGVLFHLSDGEEQRQRDANLAAGRSPLGGEWLYGHDVEAEFNQAN
ncbi:MAG TPA: hypothetical protein VEJ86_12365, partial [Candidatus Binataceae bacterium]|nr:hypothetical protein [Candidatus Binataceae bacterium]